MAGRFLYHLLFQLSDYSEELLPNKRRSVFPSNIRITNKTFATVEIRLIWFLRTLVSRTSRGFALVCFEFVLIQKKKNQLIPTI